MNRARRWIGGKRGRSTQISIVGGIPVQTYQTEPRRPSPVARLRDEPPCAACQSSVDVLFADGASLVPAILGSRWEAALRFMTPSNASESAPRPRSARQLPLASPKASRPPPTRRMGPASFSRPGRSVASARIRPSAVSYSAPSRTAPGSASAWRMRAALWAKRSVTALRRAPLSGCSGAARRIPAP